MSGRVRRVVIVLALIAAAGSGAVSDAHAARPPIVGYVDYVDGNHQAWAGNDFTLVARVDARALHVQVGKLYTVQWDFDGDGEWDLSQEYAPVTDHIDVEPIHHVYSAPQAANVGRLRLLDPENNAIASGVIQTNVPVLPAMPHVPASPPGHPGITINDEAAYTNSPDVVINPIWRSPFVDRALISNDGGFRHAKWLGMDTSIPWRLASLGPERLPKTVYVRLHEYGAGTDDTTYQDDIILDETDPVVSSASTDSSAVAATARASASRSRTAVVRVNARDKTSGVKSLQIASSRQHPGKVLAYHRSTRVKAARTLYVRVRDRAGNWSRWRRVTRRR